METLSFPQDIFPMAYCEESKLQNRATAKVESEKTEKDTSCAVVLGTLKFIPHKQLRSIFSSVNHSPSSIIHTPVTKSTILWIKNSSINNNQMHMYLNPVKYHSQ